jgi:RelA/SpoT family (p)ppGpp synthetase
LGSAPVNTGKQILPPNDAKDADVFRISDLCKILDGYMGQEEISEVYSAFLFSAEAHDGQRRLTGEPYITHPIAAAKILAEMNMDHRTIMAAILHDVIEDTPTAKKQLENVFGKDVAELVDGVTKLTQINFKNHVEAQAENFRKMVLAMAHDIRVILIKLADRLHNMRTLDVMRPDKRRRVARETLEIYAPIAQRLGMNAIRLELEDLGFAAMYPMRYRALRDAVMKARGNRKDIMTKIETSIKRRLHQEDLQGDVISRQKHLYSIYNKMLTKHLKFSEVLDVYAFRITVERMDTCYRVLGAMHNLYKPIPGTFKDYIAIPKANGYQSLHTSLFGPHGVPIEIQIRTHKMNRVAEEGIAAHWSYKSGDKSHGTTAQVKAREWMKELIKMQKEVGSSVEFIENVKVDLFPDEVYVFTPAGDIMSLPRGATVVDFAYAVHTDVGHSCVAARVDRRPAPLSTLLKNGQTVEIVTARGADPNPAWLDFVATARARSSIRAFLKNLKKREAVGLGKRLLESALDGFSKRLEDIPDKSFDELLESMKFDSRNALYEQIGLGNLAPFMIAKRLLPDTDLQENSILKRSLFRRKHKNSPLPIKGTKGVLVNFARCCWPIPGDSIVGVTTAGRGIVIHRAECRNISDKGRWLEVKWDAEYEDEFQASIRVEVANRRGVLATIATEIAEMDSNIENVNLEERDGMAIAMHFTITTHNRKHLANIMRQIRRLKSVMRITRNLG